MQIIPHIYRYDGRWWHGGIYRDEGDTNAELVREVFWLLRKGRWHFGWHWPKLVFGGIGRDWYDGPIWFAHFGILTITLTP